MATAFVVIETWEEVDVSDLDKQVSLILTNLQR